MILQFLSFVMIVMIMLYLANQGMLSALLALVTAIFGSILAMALTEPLQGIIQGWRPDYARGITFLLLFLLAFSAGRIIADICVPKNIKLPLLVNRIAGGVVGFFAGMVVVGTIILGIEMLPLGTSLLGYDRFPSGFQGASRGVAAAPSNLFLAPERFTLAVWNGASGRALGGDHAFASVHPDLDVESYGYRHTVQLESMHTLLPEFLSVPAAWMTEDAAALKKVGIGGLDGSKRIVMVRTLIKKGDKPDHGTYDSDSNFRISPAEVRLVAQNASGEVAHQYYPIGYLEKGVAFHELALNDSALVEDYAGAGSSVAEDWIFLINDDETPKLIELKQLGRVALTDIKDKPVNNLAIGEYPKRPYLKEASTLTVTYNSKSAPITEGHVYVLRHDVVKHIVQSEVDTADGQVVSKLDAMKNGGGGWAGAKNAPSRSLFIQARRASTDRYHPPGPNDPIDWSDALNIMVTGQLEPDQQQNAGTLPIYIQTKMVPLFNEGSLVVEKTLGSDGKAVLDRIPKGNFIIFSTVKTDKGFYIWVDNISVEPASKPSRTYETDNAQYKLEPQ